MPIPARQEVEATPDGYRFPARSPAGLYWLANGRGFTIWRDGRKLGVVEDVFVDPLRQRAHSVTFRRAPLGRLRKPVTVSASSLEAVVPSARLLLASSEATPFNPTRVRKRVHVSAVAARAAADSRRAAGAARPAAAATVRGLAAADATLAQLLGRAGRWVRHAASASGRWGTHADAAAGSWIKHADAATGRWVRRAASAGVRRLQHEAPHARARLVAAARAAARLTRAGAAAVRAGALLSAHLLREAAAHLAMLVAALWRHSVALVEASRAKAASSAAPRGEDVDWRSDSDTPLARDVSADNATDSSEADTAANAVSRRRTRR